MKKRLRKKKHVGEYQELGVEVTVRLRDGGDFDSFIDDFVSNAIESHGLLFGGGGQGAHLSGYVVLGRREVAHANALVLEEWLREHNGVAQHEIAEATDAWYGA